MGRPFPEPSAEPAGGLSIRARARPAGLHAVRARLSSFGVDWAILAYTAAATLFLAGAVVERRTFEPVSYPTWLWWVLPLVAGEAAGLWRSLDVSLGMRLAGIEVHRGPVASRLRRFLAWQVTGGAPFGLALLSGGVAARWGGFEAAGWASWAGAGAQDGGPSLLAVLGLAWAGGMVAAAAGYRGLWREEGQAWPDRVAGRWRGLGTPGRRAPWYATSWGWAAAVAVGVTLVTGWVVTDVDLGRLASRAARTRHIWRALLSPDPDIFMPTVGAMIETIYMALMATVLGVILAVPLSFLAARNLMSGHPVSALLYVVTRGVLNVVRSIEPLIWGIVFVVWVRVGPFAGVLALGMHSVAALGKLYSEAIEGIDPGPVEAITATGASRVQTVAYGVVPQVIPAFLSFTIYRWDINVRMSTIIGLVGGGGIGQMLFQYTNLLRWNEAATVMWLIVAVVWLMDYASARIRERIV